MSKRDNESDDEGFETSPELSERLPNEPHDESAPAPAQALAPPSRVRLLLAALLIVLLVVLVLYLIAR
jgi:hypothetical protein